MLQNYYEDVMDSNILIKRIEELYGVDHSAYYQIRLAPEQCKKVLYDKFINMKMAELQTDISKAFAQLKQIQNYMDEDKLRGNE